MKIVNLACTADFSCPLDLQAIALNFGLAMKPRFSGLPVKYEGITFMLFANGKTVILGCNDALDAELGGYAMCLKLNEMGYESRLLDFKIVNIIASGCFGRLKIIEIFHNRPHNKFSLEPELFPGLIFTEEYSTLTVTLFNSGKFIITGGKSLEQVLICYENLQHFLGRFLP